MRKILFILLILVLLVGVEAKYDTLKRGDHIKVFINYSDAVFISYEGYLTSITTDEIRMDVFKTCNLDINSQSTPKGCFDSVPPDRQILKREYIYNITMINTT
jgi:hypothetical protein